MGSSGFDIMAFAPLVLIFVVFYFLLLRPQQKKVKVHQEMLATLRRGDRIVTNGGLIGIVVKILNDQEVQVEIAENVRVKIARAMISDVLAKTEPANSSLKESLPNEETKDAPSSDAKKTKTAKTTATRKRTTPNPSKKT